MEAMASSCFARKGEFVVRNVSGETLLVPIRSCKADLDSIYVLEGVGAFIWDRLEARPSVKELIDQVCAEFEVLPDTATADTLEFIARLETAGLVEPSP